MQRKNKLGDERYQTHCNGEEKECEDILCGVVEQSLVTTNEGEDSAFVLMKSWRSQEAGAASVLVQ